MFAENFMFNGETAEEYGLVICNLDSGEISTASGGEVEINSVLAPNSNEYDYYGRSYPNVITWAFSVCKNPCGTNSQDDTYFNRDEERHIARWLLSPRGYREFTIFADNDEDVYYYCTADMTPHKIAGRVVGFDITFKSNSAFGSSKKLSRIDKFTGGKTIQIQVNNDIATDVRPMITLKNCKGNFNLINTSRDGKVIWNSKFANITHDIVLDCKNDLIDGLDKPEDFNYEFPYLVDGMNNLTCTNSDAELNIEYREVRRVII